MNHFIPTSPAEKRAILERLGIKDWKQLLSHIPKELIHEEDLNLPPPLSEPEIESYLQQLANNNLSPLIIFAGAGAYDHYVPALVDYVASKPEFYTAYTPYQAEASQGTLQALYEYQSMVAHLYAMEASNASLYDAGTGLAEALRMAIRIKQVDRVLVADTIHPYYIQVARTLLGEDKIDLLPTHDGRIEIATLRNMLNRTQYAGFALQTPNFYGILEDVDPISDTVHTHDTLLIAVANPISLALVKPPGEYDADIAIGEGQPLGIPLSFGGPYLGILVGKKKYIRQFPGRIIGKTVDLDGNPAYTMVLQTREQHIRRAQATSNICTNQTLMAIRAAVYLVVMGTYGLREVAELSLQKAHYLHKRLTELRGVDPVYSYPFFNEFLIKLPLSAEYVVERLLEYNILAGVPLSRFFPERDNELLVAVTEKRTKLEMDHFVDRLRHVINGR